MLNLLPQQEKKTIISEYKLRFSMVASIFVSLLFVVAIIGLFPSYITEKAKTNAIAESLEVAAKNTSQISLGEAQAKAAANRVLAEHIEARVSTLESSPSVSSIIARIFEQAGTSITVNDINITGKDVQIKGVASTRNELIAFHQRLRQDPDFKNASLPIADIAKSIDPPFAIAITLP